MRPIRPRRSSTAQERVVARGECQIELEKKGKDAELIAEIVSEFDEASGIGYDPRCDPHPDCPECFGEGVVKVFVKDTRDLSPMAERLYAGVEET